MCVCARACVRSETWPLILREEYGLTFPENRVLRNVFGPQKEETTGYWRKLHSEELNGFLPPSKYNLDEQIEE